MKKGIISSFLLVSMLTGLNAHAVQTQNDNVEISIVVTNDELCSLLEHKTVLGKIDDSWHLYNLDEDVEQVWSQGGTQISLYQKKWGSWQIYLQSDLKIIDSSCYDGATELQKQLLSKAADNSSRNGDFGLILLYGKEWLVFNSNLIDPWGNGYQTVLGSQSNYPDVLLPSYNISDAISSLLDKGYVVLKDNGTENAKWMSLEELKENDIICVTNDSIFDNAFYVTSDEQLLDDVLFLNNYQTIDYSYDNYKIIFDEKETPSINPFVEETTTSTSNSSVITTKTTAEETDCMDTEANSSVHEESKTTSSHKNVESKENDEKKHKYLVPTVLMALLSSAIFIFTFIKYTAHYDR